VRLEELEKQTRKQTVKDAHGTIIAAEKVGINADQLREMLVDANNWEGIIAVTKDLKAKIELEAMKAQVKADVKQDIGQALNHTGSNVMDSSSLSSSQSSATAGETNSPAKPLVETVVVTARAAAK
jgi:hypothetical protein